MTWDWLVYPALLVELILHGQPISSSFGEFPDENRIIKWSFFTLSDCRTPNRVSRRTDFARKLNANIEKTEFWMIFINVHIYMG